jgi:hypothetical protein
VVTGAKAKAGLEVTKGIDWSCDESMNELITSNGSKGRLIGADNATGWWTVSWDYKILYSKGLDSKLSEHRVGFEGFYDLKLRNSPREITLGIAV